MESNQHSMTNLFAQLGMPFSPAEIQAFIELNRPLATHLALCEAPFWTASQSLFLREEILFDADWAVIIDKLDSGLRQVVFNTP